jgi:hypothetical protein
MPRCQRILQQQLVVMVGRELLQKVGTSNPTELVISIENPSASLETMRMAFVKSRTVNQHRRKQRAGPTRRQYLPFPPHGHNPARSVNDQHQKGAPAPIRRKMGVRFALGIGVHSLVALQARAI